VKHGRNENGVWIGCYVNDEQLTEHHAHTYELIKDETSVTSTVSKLLNNGFTEVMKGNGAQHFVNKHCVLVEVYIWRHKELTINIKYTNFKDADKLQTFWNSFDLLAAGEYE